jgi:hypothetical protein
LHVFKSCVLLLLFFGRHAIFKLIFLQICLMAVVFFRTPCFSWLIHVTYQNLSKPHFSKVVSAACPAAPDLAPDCPAAHRAIPADPPNWHSEYQFGELAGMTRRPAGPPGDWPGPAGLTAGLAPPI